MYEQRISLHWQQNVPYWMWSWNIRIDLGRQKDTYIHIPLFFLIFLPIYFSHWKIWKVDFVAENKNQKHNTLPNKMKTNLPKPSTYVLFLFLIITIGLFGQHFHYPACNMTATDGRRCLFMNTKHTVEFMIFPCKVEYADRKKNPQS